MPKAGKVTKRLGGGGFDCGSVWLGLYREDRNFDLSDRNIERSLIHPGN